MTQTNGEEFCTQNNTTTNNNNTNNTNMNTPTTINNKNDQLTFHVQVWFLCICDHSYAWLKVLGEIQVSVSVDKEESLHVDWPVDFTGNE